MLADEKCPHRRTFGHMGGRCRPPRARASRAAWTEQAASADAAGIRCEKKTSRRHTTVDSFFLVERAHRLARGASIECFPDSGRPRGGVLEKDERRLEVRVSHGRRAESPVVHRIQHALGKLLVIEGVLVDLNLIG